MHSETTHDPLHSGRKRKQHRDPDTNTLKATWKDNNKSMSKNGLSVPCAKFSARSQRAPPSLPSRVPRVGLQDHRKQQVGGLTFERSAPSLCNQHNQKPYSSCPCSALLLVTSNFFGGPAGRGAAGRGLAVLLIARVRRLCSCNHVKPCP